MKKEEILKIEVKHDDPEIERQGAEAVKDFITALSKLYTGEKPEFFETEDEAEKAMVNSIQCSLTCSDGSGNPVTQHVEGCPRASHNQ